MGTLELKFQVTVRDYRETSYYALFMRKKAMFRVAAIVILACFVYAVLAVNDVLQMEPFFLVLACAYLVWVLITLAGTERQIAKYVKSPDNLLGVEYTAKFGGRMFTIEIPSRKFRVSANYTELSGAFELTNCFLLCVGQQMFIIPARGMSKEEARTLRGLLLDALGERFSSLFLKQKKK